MLTAEDARRMLAYDRRVLEVYANHLARLPWPVVSKDREVTWHSMAGVFYHILGVYDGWLNYVVQGTRADEPGGSRSWKTLRSMDEVRARMQSVWSRIDPFLEHLADAALRTKVKAPWQPKACTLEDALFQVTLEQAHHLGEIIAMLWQEDLRPPEMTWLGTNWALEDRKKTRKAKGRET